MDGGNYYLLSSLPSLVDLTAAPPLTCRDLLEHVADVSPVRARVAVLLLGDDLLQRDALHAGEIEKAEPVVLTPAQMADEQPLPDYLVTGEAQAPRRIAADATWEAYFRYAAREARRLGSVFLTAWTAHEVALRNALATERARALELEPGDYLVAADLAADENLTTLTSEWAEAADPLAGLRILDASRWQWIADHDAWFTFANDELAAYAGRLMLMSRWQRLTEAAERQETAATETA